jgi:hypothetical protein
MLVSDAPFRVEAGLGHRRLSDVETSAIEGDSPVTSSIDLADLLYS